MEREVRTIPEEKTLGDVLKNYKFPAAKIEIDTTDIDRAREKIAQLSDDLQKLGELWDSILSRISGSTTGADTPH